MIFIIFQIWLTNFLAKKEQPEHNGSDCTLMAEITDTNPLGALSTNDGLPRINYKFTYLNL